MNDETETRRRRLALVARTPGMNAAILQAVATSSPDLALLEQFEPAALAAHGLTTAAIAWLAKPDHARLDADLRWLESSGAALVACCSAGYPNLLRHAPDAPAVLYVRGNLPALREPQLAMVGSRNPTAGGRATARDFAARFARVGLCITSGMALGIDAASHEGALAAGGLTIAVLGHGLDSVYPPEHAALAERIAAQGALISE